MTLNAFVDARDGALTPEDETIGVNGRAVNGLATDIATVSSRDRTAWTISRAFHRNLDAQVRLWMPVLAGAAAAAVLGLRPVVALVVLAAWVVVHLSAEGTRLRPGLPSLATYTRQLALPFALAALAVVVGLAPERSLTRALLVTSVATGTMLLTALAQRGRRTPVRLLIAGDRSSVGQAATGWTQRKDLTLVGALLVGDQSDGADADLDYESFGLPTVQGMDDVAARAARLGADAVVVLPSPGIAFSDIRRLGWALEGTGVTLAVKTELCGVAPHRVAVTALAGCTVAEISPSRPSMLVRGLKAAIDRVGGALLLVLLAPVLAAMIVVIRLESSGPGLFTQIRVGQGGRPFRLYKMRTMCAEAEALKDRLDDVDEGNGVLFKVRRDPRITRFGGVLRRTSLDELPQLINVVRGEMSLVGPRPALPEEVAQYDEIVRRRLAVRPGMTGLWQVSGRSDLDWDTTVNLDLHYTDNITIAEDLRICLRTVGAVTSGKGAY